MKTKYFILAALAGLTFAGCSSDDLIAEAPPVNVNEGEVPIVFTSNQKAFTRADFEGADAAEKLNGKFVVTGFKGSSANSKNTASPGSIVFDNYLVEYEENTANTTESNSNNWEYVGVDPIKHATDNGITKQTIKYWDYSQTQYDFLAWGMGKVDVSGTLTPITPVYGDATLSDHEVRVSAIKPNSKDTWGSETGVSRISYTFEGKAEDLAQCYISDLVTVYKGSAGGTYNVVSNGYQQPVTLKFRQLGTKVRIGIYETVPGYSVKNVKFYTTGGLLQSDELYGATNAKIVNNATIFSASADIYTEGTYTVYFPTVDTPTDADNNQAHIKFAPKSGVPQTTTVDWGGLNYTIRESGEKETGAVYLGRTSNTASYAGEPDDNYYVVYLPNETGANLNLRVDFTLESIDGSGEIIEVKNAKAQVPSIYTQWKPGYAYTYLFKISDKTNGRTGVYDPTTTDDATVNSDPAGLYPITFDAVVVNAEDDKTQETITLVATPSITTYQQNSTVVNDNEYEAATGDIYVTVNEGDALVTLTDKANLYKIQEGMTEAEVIDALTYQNDDQPSGKILGRSGKELTNTTKVTVKGDLAADKWMLTNSVEFGADGNAIPVETDQSMRFRANAGTYAFVYTKTASTSTTDYYEARAFADFESGETKYRYAYTATTKSHTDNKGTVETSDDVDYYDAQKGVKYYTSNDASAVLMTPFIGQGVGNLYLDAAGNTIASGYAVSGTDYYYTVDGGQHYIKAHNVAYNETNSLTGLYKKSGDTYTDELGSVTQPQEGVDYYNRTGSGTNEDPYVYTYCVFLPQQVNGKFILDDDETPTYAVANESSAVGGQTYFERYIKNNGEYYTKVIKVQ